MMGMGLVGFVLVLIGYFFFISPQRDKTDQVNEQVATAQIANLGLQSRITPAQRAECQNSPSYQEQLHVAQLALPATSGMPAFLRTLQSLSGTTSTTLTTLTVGSPTSLDGGQVLSSPSRARRRRPAPSPSATRHGRSRERPGRVLDPDHGGCHGLDPRAQCLSHAAAVGPTPRRADHERRPRSVQPGGNHHDQGQRRPDHARPHHAGVRGSGTGIGAGDLESVRQPTAGS